jgi:hypothetical protein
MKTIRFSTLVALAFVPCAFAADATKPALPAKTVPQFELKNKSSFTVPNGVRSPFLPIGWKGSAVLQEAPTKKTVTTKDSFRVTSILLGSPSLAVINGRSYEEGQPIRMPKDPKTNMPVARAKLYRIGDGVIQIQLEDQLISVPLKRGELKEIQREELLNSDR